CVAILLMRLLGSDLPQATGKRCKLNYSTNQQNFARKQKHKMTIYRKFKNTEHKNNLFVSTFTQDSAKFCFLRISAKINKKTLNPLKDMRGFGRVEPIGF
ncbi:MAG: hypothetical protein NC833_04000, partial [Candidatus Omnitrophica bacterium]|nr:hypothetical protein [Candidatus Omnitrophota bacterium]